MERLYLNRVKIKQLDEQSYLSNLPVVKWLLKSEKLDFRFFLKNLGVLLIMALTGNNYDRLFFDFIDQSIGFVDTPRPVSR